VARARNIKPGLFKNEILGVADPLYTLLFEGLWILADRSGRLEDRPLRIKGEVFPYRDGLDVEAMLGWLVESGFIQRYAVDGKRYIMILEFVKHQNPHKNEAESVIPAPDEIGSESEEIGSTRADSLSSDSLSTDSLIADTPAPPPPSPKVKAKSKKPESTALPEGFGISARVRKWAKDKGYLQLEAHLEAFIAKCRAKGYFYESWDDAFMEAVREDWAKLRGRAANGSAPPPDARTTERDPALVKLEQDAKRATGPSLEDLAAHGGTEESSMTRSEALLKLLALEPETRARLIVVTGWDSEDTEAVLDTLVAEGKVTYRNGKQGDTHGERLYYPKRVPQADAGLLPGSAGAGGKPVRNARSGLVRGFAALAPVWFGSKSEATD
jgi:hypothetical protein